MRAEKEAATDEPQPAGRREKAGKGTSLVWLRPPKADGEPPRARSLLGPGPCPCPGLGCWMRRRGELLLAEAGPERVKKEEKDG